MAIQCTNCGTTLPRDDARFCTNCGTLVPSHPFSPRTSSSTKSSSTPLTESDQSKGKPVLREQHAQLTPLRPSGQSAAEATPARSSRPENRQSATSISEGKKEQQGGKSPAVTNDPDQLSEFEQKARQALGKQNMAPSAFGSIQNQLPEGSRKKPRFSREVQPLPEDRRSADLPTRHQSVPELRSKVWGSKEQSATPAVSAKSPGVKDDEIIQKEQGLKEASAKASDNQKPEMLRTMDSKATSPEMTKDEIANQPTSALSEVQSEIADRDTAAYSVPENQKTEKAGRNPRDFFDGQDAIPDIPTTPISVPVSPVAEPIDEAARAKVPEVVRVSTPAPDQERSFHQNQPSVPPETPQNWQMGAPVTPAPAWQVRSAVSSLSSKIPRIDTSKFAAIATGAIKRRPKRWPLYLGGALVLIILVVSLLVVTNPFAISPITQPNTTFTNANLKVSLAYPTDWKANVNQANTSAHFYDSTNTGQATLSMAGGSQDLKQFLKARANQLGMSSVTAASPVSFGGATWQQVKGTLQQGGASYAGTLLATQHQGQIYTLLQLAPQATYSQEEQVIFSPMRSSFKFMG